MFDRTAPARPTFRPRLETLEDRTVPATLQTGFSETVVGSGLTRPTALTIARDGRFLISDRAGTPRVGSFNRLQPTPALTLTVDSQGERGLLGVTTDPNYLQNHFIYVYYTVPGAASHNRV